MVKLTAQAQLNHAQAQYEVYLSALRALDGACAAYQEAHLLKGQMEDFLANVYLDLIDIDAKTPLDTQTQGALSVLNQDAVYNALVEHRALILAQMRALIQMLE